MTYLVNEKCIKCKYTDCVEVCPVDCFYEGENMLVINPDECIDCGVCEPECPVDAIISDADDKDKKWLEVNQKFSEIWPNITMKKDSPTDAKMYESEENKYDKYFFNFFFFNGLYFEKLFNFFRLIVSRINNSIINFFIRLWRKFRLYKFLYFFCFFNNFFYLFLFWSLLY